MSRAEAASLLGWWVEAGVDVAVQEEARDWRRPSSPLPLAQGPASGGSEAVQVAAAATHQRPSAIERPATLEAFHAWLAETADLPLFRAGAARALPHGPAEAEVMLVTGIPTAEDAAAGQPIGGDAWVLTVRMLAAIGIRPEQAYVAALTCFPANGSRFSPAETETCRDTILDQIRLAAPKRLLLLGDAPAKLLLNHPVAVARGKVHHLAGIPTVATFSPRHLLERSDDKKLAWADLLLLMGEHR